MGQVGLLAPQRTNWCSAAANGGGFRLGLILASGRWASHEGAVEDWAREHE